MSRILAVLAAAYFAVVTVGVIAGYDQGSLASSPDGVADGEVWRLLSSGLIVNGRLPLAQVGLTALAAFLVIRALGALAWWGATLSAHVGSALVAYAAIAVAEALGVASAGRAENDPDYGISIVLAGSLGALFATSLRHGRRRSAALAGLALVAYIPISDGWYGVEHPLGFVFGAAFTAWWERGKAE